MLDTFLNFTLAFYAVFSRLHRRQAQFFREASSGLLALVRLATQDEGDDEGEEETSIDSVQGMEGGNIIPLEQVRAAIVENIVQLAQVVRETCDAVDVSSHPKTCEMGCRTFTDICATVTCILQPLLFEIVKFASIASVLSMLNVWNTCRLTNSVKISNKDLECLYFRHWLESGANF